MEHQRVPRTPLPTATLAAKLLGANEISTTTGRRRAGDLDGEGGAVVTIKPGKLCAGIVVQGIDTPVALHVHAGGPRVNDPVVVPLTPPTSGDPGASAACVDVADQALLDNIRRRPHRFYVNIHTAAFPNGALRGQLHRLTRRR